MQDLMRNLLLGGGGGFSPQSLFTGGVEGALYDPSDLSTLYQDSVGTTPVTGVEQVVGLMLDKSKNLALGPEVVVYPLSAGSLGASYSIVGDAIVRNGSTGTALLNPVGGVIPSTSKIYLVTFTASGVTGDSVAVRVGGGTAYGPFAGNGTFTLRVPGGGITGAITFLPFAGGAATATYSNISVRELPGNHATSTGSARPTLSARVNLLTYSEEFDNGAWQPALVTVTANTFVAPDGSLTADTLASTNGYIFQEVAGLTANAVYTGSIYLYAPVAINGLFIRFTNTSFVALGSGAYVNVTAGWNKFTFTDNIGANTTIRFVIGGGGTFPNGTSMYAWGADLRPANIGVNIPSYQRIAAATNYDTNGFPFYLSFGGAQSMSTPANLDLTSTDKVTVYAGVRKLSDAIQAITELSLDINANNGAFEFFCNSPNTLEFGSKGTIGVFPSAAAPAPTTRVMTGIGDISGDSAILRLGGAQVAQSTANQGTGNYGTYPLYIGARNNASTWFTGYLYSLIIQGAAASATQLASTEAWVNQKTKAY